MTSIAVLGEFDPDNATHVATDAAIEHSARCLGAEVTACWVATGNYRPTLFDEHAALWMAPGSPYRNFDNALSAIGFAREHRVPCFGTCGGFQHMILEYARSVLGLRDAAHAEYQPDASELFISGLYCSLRGRELTVELVAGSQAAKCYGASRAIERYYCNFGVNPDYLPRLRGGPLRISGSDPEGEVRVIELPDHPFFVGTLFVPQARSTAADPHPLVTGFVAAALAAVRSADVVQRPAVP